LRQKQLSKQNETCVRIVFLSYQCVRSTDTNALSVHLIDLQVARSSSTLISIMKQLWLVMPNVEHAQNTPQASHVNSELAPGREIVLAPKITKDVERDAQSVLHCRNHAASA
jgi:hypothetical protein